MDGSIHGTTGEEIMKDLKSISLKDAKKMLKAMEEKAEELGIGFSFCILDALENTLIFEKMDNTSKSSEYMAKAKAQTSLRLGTSTRNIAALKKKQGFEIASFGGNCKTDVIGGISLYAKKDDQEPAGAIGVSGATQEVDEEVAIAGAKAIDMMIK